jgi:hypothetical protein
MLFLDEKKSPAQPIMANPAFTTIVNNTELNIYFITTRPLPGI